ncbi:MAG: DUF3810 domain-containing protein [Edaphocola sp.]
MMGKTESISTKKWQAFRLRNCVLVGLLVFLSIFQYALAHSVGFLTFYMAYVYRPMQKMRSAVLNGIPFSVGDIFYLLLGIALLAAIVRMVYFLLTFRKNRNEVITETVRFLNVPLVVYAIFLISWGGNYYRKPLSGHWPLAHVNWDSGALLKMNISIVEHLNRERLFATRFPNLKSTNAIANQLYHIRYGDKIAALKVKPTALGYALSYLGIQGYVNPFSGEAQFNRFIPPFMHPFVVCHEMAHQAGIAAEDDANLLAFVVGSESNVPAFRYSAWFNLFLYAYGDLKATDSTAAKTIFNTLNLQTRNDLDTLRTMQRRYRSSFRKYSTRLYDGYLRLHGQHDGINSYNDVVRWVYLRQQLGNEKADLPVCPW